MATLFSFIAIVLGVALGMAVQAVHEAALSEFGRGLRAMVGEADLQVVGPRGGFDENSYALLASRPEVAEASPILELQVKRAGSEESLQLLGIDLFALARVTPVLLPKPASTAERLAALAEDSVFLSSAAQSALGRKPGDEIEFQAGTTYRSFKIAGELPGVAENRQLAVMDIAAVQSHFGQLQVNPGQPAKLAKMRLHGGDIHHGQLPVFGDSGKLTGNLETPVRRPGLKLDLVARLPAQRALRGATEKNTVFRQGGQPFCGRRRFWQ